MLNRRISSAVVVLACAASLPLGTLGFSSSSLATRSPLFRSSSNDINKKISLLAPLASSSSSSAVGNSNEPIIREIEKKLKKLSSEKEKAQLKLDKAQDTIQMLESKKAEYLGGASLADTPEGGNFSETTLRSAVKALMWRVIAGSVTFITSLRFSGSVIVALEIVASDFFSKALTMFIGERLMNKSKAGRKSGGDSTGRSLAKALVWRLFAICNTLTMAIFVAKDLSIASKIAGTDAVFKTALMFVYERVWAKISWGKEYLVEFSI